MTRRRHTPDQNIRKLAEGQKLLAGGLTMILVGSAMLKKIVSFKG